MIPGYPDGPIDAFNTPNKLMEVEALSIKSLPLQLQKLYFLLLYFNHLRLIPLSREKSQQIILSSPYTTVTCISTNQKVHTMSILIVKTRYALHVPSVIPITKPSIV